MTHFPSLENEQLVPQSAPSAPHRMHESHNRNGQEVTRYRAFDEFGSPAYAFLRLARRLSDSERPPLPIVLGDRCGL